MRRILLLGRTGVGKSSFVNLAANGQVAATSRYEACTKVVEHYLQRTPWGDICLVDTPGLAEGDAAQDAAYLDLIERRADPAGIDVFLYLTRLNETRLQADEIRTLRALAQRFGPWMRGRTWLFFSFAASVGADRRDQAFGARQAQVQGVLREYLGPRFAPQHVFLIDNIVRDWSPRLVDLTPYLACGA